MLQQPYQLQPMKPASIVISATGADSDGTISKVEFYNGTTLLGSDNNSPYSYSWTNVASGSYSITAKAYDNTGASTISSPVAVVVSAQNISPTVTLTSPIASQAYIAFLSKAISVKVQSTSNVDHH